MITNFETLMGSRSKEGLTTKRKGFSKEKSLDEEDACKKKYPLRKAITNEATEYIGCF